MLATLAASTLVAIAIIAYAMKRDGLTETLSSLLYYFTFLWFLAFPLRAFLLSQLAIPTQTMKFYTPEELIPALAVSTVFLLAVAGGYIFHRERNSDIPQQRWAVQAEEGLPRIAAFVIFSCALSLFVTYIYAFEDGQYIHRLADSAMQTRPGRGWLFFSAELFVNSLVLLAAYIALSRRALTWQTSLLILLLIVTALLVMQAFTTRRVVGYAAMLAVTVFAIKYVRFKILVPLAIVGMVFAAPALQVVRYTCWVCYIAPHAVVGEAARYAFASDFQRALDRLTELLAETERRTLGNEEAAETRFLIRLIRDNNIELSSSMHEQIEDFYAITADESMEFYFGLFLTSNSSSFEGVDHLAEYLKRASWAQLLSGVDYGQAWLFNAALSNVPRAIWPEKPLIYGSASAQHWLHPETFQGAFANVALPPSIIVDFFFAFGAIAGLGLAFLLGMGLRIINHALYTGTDLYIKSLSLFIFINMFNIVRGGTGFLGVLLVFAAIAAVVLWRPGRQQRQLA